LLLGRSRISHGYEALDAQSGARNELGGTKAPFLPYWRLLQDSTLLGFEDAQIGLGYLGGFVPGPHPLVSRYSFLSISMPTSPGMAFAKVRQMTLHLSSKRNVEQLISYPPN